MMQLERQQRVADAVMKLWERSRDSVQARLSLLEEVAAAWAEGEYPEEQRLTALREVHKLIGSLGTFGHSAGTSLAREIQSLLAGEGQGRPEAEAVARYVRRLREILEQPPSCSGESLPVAAGGAGLRVAVAGLGPDLGAQLAAEVERRGFACTVAESLAALESERPDGAVVWWLPADQGAQEQITRLAAQVPVVVLVPYVDFAVRLAVARMGARGCFVSPAPPTQVADKVQQLLLRHRAPTGTVLVVDDDPDMLSVVALLLKELGLTPVTLGEPARFWEVLEETGPDLVVLDVAMPGLSGIDLCQVMRNDQRWSSLPVLFLTAHSDAETLHRIFSSGADDYVSKPVVGPELANRIGNRLERTQLHRHMAETDVLTGVSNRRKSAQQLEQFLRLGTRQQLPLSLALLDLDRFKQVNDRWGHATGDVVLRRFGEFLTSSFRGEDVVARWGGEEFVVGMYGVYKERAAVRIQQLLTRFAAEQFIAPDGSTFQVTFSAGVAEGTADADDLTLLYRVADAALYRAKAAGRARVLLA